MMSSDPSMGVIWSITLDAVADLEPLAAMLSPDEQARATRFVFERDRRRFVVARCALRSILSTYVGIPAAALELQYARRRKPMLSPRCGGDRVRFNLSHSGELALVVVAQGHEVGIDVEEVRFLRDLDSIVAREFSARERAAFKVLPPRARQEAFFRAWVHKEAFLKATGEGLYRPLADVEVTFAPDEPAQLLAVGGDASASALWSMISLTVPPGYVAALVTAGAPMRLATHHLEGNSIGRGISTGSANLARCMRGPSRG